MIMPDAPKTSWFLLRPCLAASEKTPGSQDFSWHVKRHATERYHNRDAHESQEWFFT
jgi:hypothetical protein